MSTPSATEKHESNVQDWGLYRHKERDLRVLAATVSSLLLTLAAFVLNMGWVRFILVFTALPLIAFGLHLILGLILYWRRQRSRLFQALCVLHPLSYVLLSDVGDVDPPRIFFGLVKVAPAWSGLDTLLSGLAALCMLLTLGSLARLVVQLWRTRSGATPSN